jgi:hypothetical protein
MFQVWTFEISVLTFHLYNSSGPQIISQQVELDWNLINLISKFVHIRPIKHLEHQSVQLLSVRTSYFSSDFLDSNILRKAFLQLQKLLLKEFSDLEFPDL